MVLRRPGRRQHLDPAKAWRIHMSAARQAAPRGDRGAMADNGDRANRNDGLKTRFNPATWYRQVPAAAS